MSTAVKAVKITTDNKVSVVELPSWSYQAQEEAIGADYTEIVKTQRMMELFKQEVVMLVDESGLVKKRDVNLVASFLYGYDRHGHPICGDVLLAIQEGPEIFPVDNPERLAVFLKQRFPLLELEIKLK